MAKHVWFKNPWVWCGLAVAGIAVYAYSQKTEQDPRFHGGGAIGRIYMGQTHATWTEDPRPLDREPPPTRQHTTFGGDI